MDDPAILLGFDIGGTKTAAILGTLEGQILRRAEMLTPASEPFEIALAGMVSLAEKLLTSAGKAGLGPVRAISVSVGGPLDIEQGIIYSPPHLPTWDRAPLKIRLEEHFSLPVYVEHDGNAGALAEYYFGTGRGARNLVFLTLGTGLGAGLILDGKIYRGTTYTAGEVGHLRVAEHGPTAYGKQGSWEAFCSGYGLVELARLRDPQRWPLGTDTRQVVEAALSGDPDAQRLVQEMGEWFGRGLAVLVDLLNPEVIVVGTLGVVLGDLLLEPARRVLEIEALPIPRRACRVVPASLGRALGDVAALSAAIDAFHAGRLSFS